MVLLISCNFLVFLCWCFFKCRLFRVRGFGGIDIEILLRFILGIRFLVVEILVLEISVVINCVIEVGVVWNDDNVVIGIVENVFKVFERLRFCFEEVDFFVVVIGGIIENIDLMEIRFLGGDFRG